MSQPFPATTAIPTNEPKLHKWKAKFPEQTLPAAQKPHRLTTTTLKTAAPSTLTPKTIVPMPVIVEANDKTEENTPDETLA